MKQSACFIGHRTIDDTPELRARVRRVLETLVENGTIYFIFGDHSAFDRLCYELVTELKEKIPAIRRIHFRADYGEVDDYTKNLLLRGYEESRCPPGVENAGRARYVARNQAMIRESSVCVFYFDETYCPDRRKSGTAAAFAYATQQNKPIIRLHS